MNYFQANQNCESPKTTKSLVFTTHKSICRYEHDVQCSESVKQLAFAQDHRSLKRFWKEFPTISSLEQRLWDNLLACVLENLINGNWQEQRIHFIRNQSWIRVQSSDQISLWRRGFRLFMLKMPWKISLPQRVIISNRKFILRNIQTERELNISLTLATWSPGLLSPFL